MTSSTRIPLPLLRDVRGALFGEHSDIHVGPGDEDAGAVPYLPGDDVRRIDWPLSARTGVTHARRTLASREAVLAFAFDTSASMWFATTMPTKLDVALGVGRAITHAGAGDVRAVIVNRGERPGTPLPPRQALQCWSDPGPPTKSDTFATALRHARQVMRGGGGIVVAIGDFHRPASWETELARTAAAASLVAICVRDRHEIEPAPSRSGWIEDPETGKRAWVDQRSAGELVELRRVEHERVLRILRRSTPWVSSLRAGLGWQKQLVTDLRRIGDRHREI